MTAAHRRLTIQDVPYVQAGNKVNLSNRYLYGSGLFLAGILCSTVSKQPGACPRLAALFQRLIIHDRVTARKLCDAQEAASTEP